MTEQAPTPEQVFFADPAMDRMMGMIMALAAEVFVLRCRVRQLDPDRTGGDEAADVDAFVRHLLQPALGERPAADRP